VYLLSFLGEVLRVTKNGFEKCKDIDIKKLHIKGKGKGETRDVQHVILFHLYTPNCKNVVLRFRELGR